jgi:hypothetical protein
MGCMFIMECVWLCMHIMDLRDGSIQWLKRHIIIYFVVWGLDKILFGYRV